MNDLAIRRITTADDCRRPSPPPLLFSTSAAAIELFSSIIPWKGSEVFRVVIVG